MDNETVLYFFIQKFLFNAVSGVLSNHLGWVGTVMPGSTKGENLLQKPPARGIQQ
jgi:hypothetical protein